MNPDGGCANSNGWTATVCTFVNKTYTGSRLDGGERSTDVLIALGLLLNSSKLATPALSAGHLRSLRLSSGGTQDNVTAAKL